MNGYDLLRGTVTAYPDDPDRGLVEVTLGGYAQGQDTLLARVEPNLTGVYWLPEIGDAVEVRVSRAPGGEAQLLRVRRPQGDGQTAACWSGTNDRKQIATRSGHKITLDDTQGKTAIRIQTAGGICLILEDETQTLTVSALEAETPVLQLDMQNDALRVAAGQTCTVTCAGAALEINSEGNVRLQAKEKLEVSGKELCFTAKETLTLQGREVKIAGSMETAVSGENRLELASSGVTAVKGGAVQLN